MPPYATKFAPQVVVLVVAIYWSWNALSALLPGSGEAATKKTAKPAAVLQGFTAASLAPKFAAPPKRDPFFPEAARSRKTAKSRKSINGAKGKRGKADTANSLGFVLGATCITGDRRLAVINGDIYGEKEMVRPSGSLPSNCLVTEIFPHKVVLSHEGRFLQLNYSDVATNHKDNAAARRKPTKSD